jgi:type IV pilus assembly protein PilE
MCDQGHELFKGTFFNKAFLNRTTAINKNQGMTLVELMVVIAIIGILITLMYPSFQHQIMASRRSDGATQLLRLKLQQEAYRLENTLYASTAQLAMPSSEYYVFSVSSESASTYTLTAKAISSQKADNKCLSIHIDQSMNKTPSSCF